MDDRPGDPDDAGPSRAFAGPPGGDEDPDRPVGAPFSWAEPGGGGRTPPGEPLVGSRQVSPTEEPVWAPDREPGADRTPGGSSGPGGARNRWGSGWLPVAAVSALIGAGVAAGVSALTRSSAPNPSGITTIKESSAAPGPAVLGGTNIPKLVASVLPAVVSIDVKTSLEEAEGTGMIISPNGLVVTNYHVVALAAEDGGQLTVTESGSTSPVKATLVGTDPADDIALVRIDKASDLKTVTFGDSTKAEVGDAVVAIGNALGLSQGSPTVTSGIVSAVGRTVAASGSSEGSETLSDLIQTDAAINPGNSGGPLIDSEGQVIGMNTAVAGTTSDGTSAQNIGFAIPSAEIETLLPTLENRNATVSAPGYMGVDIATLTPQLRAEYGFTPSAGAVIISVVQGGPADQAGLELADVIVAIGSKPVASVSDLQTAVQSSRAGQTIKVTYYRGTSRRTASVTLVSASQLQNLEAQTGG